MKVPRFNWIPFDKDHPPVDLRFADEYLVLIREKYKDGRSDRYSVDFGSPFGSYINDFWDVSNDWIETSSTHVDVIAYAEPPFQLLESDLEEIDILGGK